MILAIKDGFVRGRHTNSSHTMKELQDAYPDCEIVKWDGKFNMPGPDKRELAKDPRSKEDKLLAYQDKRQIVYPPVEEQLDMMYWDLVRNTEKWRETIAVIKAENPKP